MDDDGPSFNLVAPLVASAVAAVFFAAYLVLTPSRPVTVQSTWTPPAPTAAGPIVVSREGDLHPISFYAARCASCHGDYGELYGFLGQPVENEYLLEVIPRMVKLHGKVELDAAGLAAQIAYARSLSDGAAFLTVPPSADESGVIRGEVTPGAVVVARRGERAVEAVVEGHVYTIRWMEKDPPEKVEAELNGRVTSLLFGGGEGAGKDGYKPHSHGAGGVQ